VRDLFHGVFLLVGLCPRWGVNGSEYGGTILQNCLSAIIRGLKKSADKPVPRVIEQAAVPTLATEAKGLPLSIVEDYAMRTVFGRKTVKNVGSFGKIGNV
jgi:hypothetical protein